MNTKGFAHIALLVVGIFAFVFFTYFVSPVDFYAKVTTLTAKAAGNPFCSANGSKSMVFLSSQIARWTYTYPNSTKVTQLTLPANPSVRFEVSSPNGSFYAGQWNQTLVAPLGAGDSTFYITAYMNSCTTFTEQFKIKLMCGSEVDDFLGLGSQACPIAADGYVDLVRGGLCQISGWARDGNSLNTDLDIVVYKDRELGQGGNIVAQGKTSYARGDVSGGRGYTLQLPPGFSGQFYVYAQGVNSAGQKDGTNSLLQLYTPNVPNASLSCASPLMSDEGSKVVDLKSQVGFKVGLGAVEPVMAANEWGIAGAAPDGHVAVKKVGNLTKTFFTCFDGVGSSSSTCLSENYSIDDFNNMAGLYKNSRFISVLPSGNQTLALNGRSYESKYAGLTSVWDDGRGTLHGWYHAEEYLDDNRAFKNSESPCQYAHYATVGYAISTDGGRSFVKQSPVLDSGIPKQVTSDCGSQGTSHPKVIQSGDYLYMFFDWWTPTFLDGGVSVARAHKSNPREWKKYYINDFTQPGIGGAVTPIIKRGGTNSNLWSPNVIWSSAVNKFIMLHSDFSREGAIYVRTSPDLIKWSDPSLLVASSNFSYRYPSLIGADDTLISNNGWIYFARTPIGGRIGLDSLMARRKISFF